MALGLTLIAQTSLPHEDAEGIHIRGQTVALRSEDLGGCKKQNKYSA